MEGWGPGPWCLQLPSLPQRTLERTVGTGPSWELRPLQPVSLLVRATHSSQGTDVTCHMTSGTLVRGAAYPSLRLAPLVPRGWESGSRARRVVLGAFWAAGTCRTQAASRGQLLSSGLYRGGGVMPPGTLADRTLPAEVEPGLAKLQLLE